MVHNASQDAVSAAARRTAQLFIQCFPLLLTDMVRRVHPVGLHQFQLLQQGSGVIAPGLAEPDPRTVISTAWLDLGNEPLVLRLPDTHDRYISVCLYDTAGDLVTAIGSRTGDDTGGDLALAGPSWRGEFARPSRARRMRTDCVWAVSRIQAHGVLDRAETEALARRQRVTPIPVGPEVESLPCSTLDPPARSTVRQALEIAPSLFLHRLDPILARAPLSYQRDVRARLASIREQIAELQGLDGEFDPDRAFAEEFAAAAAAIQVAAKTEPPRRPSGWRAPDSDEPPTSPRHAAARAYASLGAAPRDDLLRLVCETDEFGAPLSGVNGYTLQFAADQLPPVSGTWSLMVHPPQRQGRPLISDHSELNLNPDGSLDIVIQGAPPEASEIFNWLPVPEEPFSLEMRLYGPRGPALNLGWRMPAIHRSPPRDVSAAPRAAPAPGGHLSSVDEIERLFR